MEILLEDVAILKLTIDFERLLAYFSKTIFVTENISFAVPSKTITLAIIFNILRIMFPARFN